MNDVSMMLYNLESYDKIEILGYNYINSKLEEVRYNFEIGTYGIEISDLDINLENNYYGIFESENNTFTEPIKVE